MIYSLNARPISGVGDLKTALAALKPNAPAVSQIERESTLTYLAFRIER